MSVTPTRVGTGVFVGVGLGATRVGIGAAVGITVRTGTGVAVGAGAVVAVDGLGDYNLNNETTAGNESNDTQAMNESTEKTINITLEYKNGSIYDSDNDGIESADSAIDYTVENSVFNWDVNKSNLCNILIQKRMRP